MLKQNIRILGVDDGPFSRDRDTETCLTGVLMRMDGTIENVVVARIRIDGADSTPAILNFVDKIGRQNINAIVAEGVTFGGFDIVDPQEINRSTGIPFLSVTKGEGNLDAMLAALSKHGNEEKISILERLTPFRETFGETEFTLNISGIEGKEALILLRKLMRVGNVPEPVRIADMISLAVMKVMKNDP